MTRPKQQSPHPPTAFSYKRFSSPIQSTGDSLRRQTELLDTWLAKSGAVLDTSLVMTDRGVSAFTGSHRDNPDRHALAAFLEMVKAGRVPRGSYLVLESLDRLTREHIRPALTLLLNLIDAGVKVVQLLPVEAVYDDDADAMNLMVAIMELSRGHSESRMKSERLGAAWAQKKRLAAAEKKPLTKALPSWVAEEAGKLVLIPSKAASVRRIFELANSGHGLGAITRLLNSEAVSAIGRGAHWSRSYVNKILASRATVGEYQPYKGHVGPNRKPDGKPIAGYFPAVVTEDVWHAAQGAIASRRMKGGRPGANVNLFSGLLTDARDGGSLHSVNKGKKNSGPSLVSYKAAQGVKGAKYVSFPRETFEAAVLSQLREINPADVMPEGSAATDRVSSLRGRELELESRIERLKAALVSGDEIAPLVDVLRTVEGERVKVVEELAVARREAASPAGAALGEFKTLADALAEAENQTEARTRLRAALRRAVESIHCLFVARDPFRLAAVQVQFAGGARRLYLIQHRRGHGSQAAIKRAASWSARSFADDVPAATTIDLRKPADAAKVEKLLERLDITAAD